MEVDIPSGRLRFKAWRRMRWLDERLKWNPVRACGRAPVDLKSVASGHSPLYMVPSQDEFDGIKTTLVYPDSPLATDLDDNLWLPDIATCDAHHTTCTQRYLITCLAWAQVQLGSIPLICLRTRRRVGSLGRARALLGGGHSRPHLPAFPARSNAPRFVALPLTAASHLLTTNPHPTSLSEPQHCDSPNPLH